MKIAQIAPLAESVPPRLYGGTERIVLVGPAVINVMDTLSK